MRTYLDIVSIAGPARVNHSPESWHIISTRNGLILRTVEPARTLQEPPERSELARIIQHSQSSPEPVEIARAS
jgi:hypothetical protein